MSVLAAILLAFAVISAQVLHGGLYVPAFLLPADALLVVAALLSIWPLWRNPAPVARAGIVAFTIFTAYMVWRCGTSPDGYLGRIESQLLLAGALAFFVASGLQQNRARFVLLIFLGTVAAGQAAVGLLQFARGDVIAPFGWFSAILESQYGDRFASRAHGFFLNPNQFAWLMAWSALFTISFAAWARTTVLIRVILIYFALVFVAMTVLSGSRGGAVSLLVGMIVFMTLSVVALANTRMRGRAGVIAGLLALLVVCVAAGFVVYSSNWLTQGRVDTISSDTSIRTALLENAWREFQTSPLIGTGAEMFRYAARAYRIGGQNGDPIFAHSDWMQILSDYGFIGFSLALIAILLLWGGGVARLVALVAIQAKAGDRPFSNTAALLAGGLSSVAAFFTHSFTDFNLHVPANALLGALTLGLVASASGLPAANRVRLAWWKNAPMRIFVTVVLCAMGATLGKSLSRHGAADYATLQSDNLLENGVIFDALDAAERGLARDPENVGLLLAKGKAEYDYLSAEQADEMPARPPLTPWKLRQLFEGSADAYARALQRQPFERTSEMGLANALISLHRAPEAAPHFLEAIRLDPRHSFAYIAYADALYDQGEVARALRILDVASTLPAGWQEASDRRIEIYDELSPPDDADPASTP